MAFSEPPCDMTEMLMLGFNRNAGQIYLAVITGFMEDSSVTLSDPNKNVLY